MEQADIVIIGAGITGLSCAYHLQHVFGKTCLILEAEHEAGGVARSVHADGFTFDYTGHVLHLKNSYVVELVKKLLRHNLRLCYRNARIYSHGIYTRYPFQANTFGLPHNVIKDCVLGFMEAGKLRQNKIVAPVNQSFYDWAIITFGQGITRHFMAPYNKKLWARPVTGISSDWCGPFVPVPKLEEVVCGALTNQKKRFGYNATFYYPVRGGIQVLSQELARNLNNLRLGAKVVKINSGKRELTLADGNRLKYGRLVTTMPLVNILEIIEDAPPKIKRMSSLLKWTSVLCLNIGVARPRIAPYSWVYFPENEFVFYRVGFSSNFSQHIAPKNCTSMYIEVSYRPGKRPDMKIMMNKTLGNLRKCGLVRRDDKIIVKNFLDIPCAYVVPDAEREPARNAIFKYLSSKNIIPAGRYGAWKYSYMEENILDGKDIAEKLCK